MNLSRPITSTLWLELVLEGYTHNSLDGDDMLIFWRRLVAILLGRLRLSVPEAIEVYRVLAKDVFSTTKAVGKDGRYKASNLETAVKSVLVEKLGEGHSEEKMFESDNDTGRICKT